MNICLSYFIELNFNDSISKSFLLLTKYITYFQVATSPADDSGDRDPPDRSELTDGPEKQGFLLIFGETVSSRKYVRLYIRKHYVIYPFNWQFYIIHFFSNCRVDPENKVLLEFVNLKVRKIYMKEEKFQDVPFEPPGPTGGLGTPGPGIDTE